jgi:eukaryotic-like serine/threonine-protein kinase
VPSQTARPATATATATPSQHPTETPRVTPAPQAAETRAFAPDNAMMVYVPAGEFRMGSDDADKDARPNEQPPHTVYQDAFWIDKLQVTNALYGKCVEAGKCHPPSNASSNTRASYYGDGHFDNYPVIYVSWDDAVAYCTWAGKRLPTEAEWEKAARGTDGRIYPWGNTFGENLLNSSESGNGDTTAVGTYPNGASPYGALDMVGNVWQWAADWYDDKYYANSPPSNPTGSSSGQSRVLRGGSFYFSQKVRAANRGYDTPTGTFNDVGLRCARSP